ncbi:MAG TPA: DUF6580 family putative transport protein [Edaphocola sp.]|nr:DUF6580 family putative transport protein [Edaphocola sp.]
MKGNKNTFTILSCTALVMLAVISRIINTETHWYGFAPVVAISLFSGAILKNKAYAYLLPLAVYLLSDIFLGLFTGTQGFYGISQFFVYGAMALVVLLGTGMRRPKPLRILGFTLGGSAIFWIVSNLGVFAAGYYGYSFEGLTTTYLMAIPFYTPMGSGMFINAFVGDLLFSGLLFGIYALISQYSAASRLGLAAKK